MPCLRKLFGSYRRADATVQVFYASQSLLRAIKPFMSRPCECFLIPRNKTPRPMSRPHGRAFVKETDAETIELPERPVSEHPNFVTAEGLTAIERERDRYAAA